MGGATTFACKSQGCQWAGLVYFIIEGLDNNCGAASWSFGRDPRGMTSSSLYTEMPIFLVFGFLILDMASPGVLKDPKSSFV